MTKSDLDRAMADVNIEDSDQEVFDRLFTLFDKTGAGKVDYLELVVGLSPVVAGTLEDRLLLAFELADEEGMGHASKEQTLSVLTSLSSTASFLGDAPLSPSSLSDLVESLFVLAEETGTEGEPAFGYAENVGAVAEHPVVEEWLRRGGEEEGG